MDVVLQRDPKRVCELQVTQILLSSSLRMLLQCYDRSAPAHMSKFRTLCMAKT